MGKARRLHFIRSSLSAAAVILLVVLGIGLNNSATEQRNDAEATRLVEGLLQADTSQVKSIINNLSDYRKWTKDDLASAYAEPPADLPNAKLHAALAMLSDDDSVLEFLSDRLLAVSPVQFEHVRNLLDDHKGDLNDGYWKVAQDTGQDPARRFQAVSALATYDPENEHWQDKEFGEFVAGHLVSVLPSELLPWRNALRPVKEHLSTPLATIYRDDNKGEQIRSFATDTLADYLSDDTEGLFNLLADAEQQQFPALFGKLTAHQKRAIELGNRRSHQGSSTGRQRGRQRNLGDASGERCCDADADERPGSGMAAAQTQPRPTSPEVTSSIGWPRWMATRRQLLHATNRKRMSRSNERCC